MRVWFLIESVVFVVLCYGALTQLVVPLLSDAPLFPLFRRRRRDAGEAITSAREHADVVGMREYARKLREQHRADRRQRREEGVEFKPEATSEQKYHPQPKRNPPK